MAKPTVSLQVDGIMVLTGIAALAVIAIYLKRDAIADAIGAAGSSAVNLVNPNSSQNVVNRAATAVVGEQNLANAFDYIYGAVDLVTYLATGYETETAGYARKVYGVEDSWLFGVPGWNFKN